MKRVSKEEHIYAFAKEMQPVLIVESGSQVVFETYDCYRGRLTIASRNEIHSLPGINPATGPVAVSGAEPGDTLKVTIQAIQLDQEGTMYIRPGSGVLKNCVEHPEVKKFPIANGTIQVHRDHTVPIRPMIGVIGVSPKDGSIPTISPGSHGGNMDTREITEGAAIYLPVSVPGANLALGDLHAVMGDGEVPVCGVEIGGTVQVRVEVIKGVQFPVPVVEDEACFYVIASAHTLDDAARLAAEHMFQFLRERLPFLPANDIVCLMGMKGHARISQLVNPLKTAKFLVPKETFPVQFAV
jgi:amidase